MNSTWQQVLGGKAFITFNAETNDTLALSTVKDSLDLKSISTYNKKLVQATYDVAMNTSSASVVDTFIRFNAKANE